MSGKVYILFEHDRHWSSEWPKGTKPIMGQMNERGLALLAQTGTVFILRLKDGEMTVEKMGGETQLEDG